MEAVQHYFKTIERGHQQLTIDLPEGVDKAEVEVTVRPLHEPQTELVKLSQQEIAQRFRGALANSSYINTMRDDDVYYQ